MTDYVRIVLVVEDVLQWMSLKSASYYKTEEIYIYNKDGISINDFNASFIKVRNNYETQPVLLGFNRCSSTFQMFYVVSLFWTLFWTQVFA